MDSDWKSLGLSDAILETLEELKFEKMTPVQVRFERKCQKMQHFTLMKHDRFRSIDLLFIRLKEQKN